MSIDITNQEQLRHWRDTLPATAQPFFLFSVFAGMVPPFSPFSPGDPGDVRDPGDSPPPRFIDLIFAYTCEAWIGIKPSVVYFRHLFSPRPSGLNQSSGCVSFITTARTEGDFIDLKGMKKVEDFRSRWLFVDNLKESELFLPSSSPLGPARHSLKRP
jgi:hypothetical protein